MEHVSQIVLCDIRWLKQHLLRELRIVACCLFQYDPICTIYGRNSQGLPFLDNILPYISFPLHSQFADHLGQDFKIISCHCCFVFVFFFKSLKISFLFVRLVDILKYASYISQIIIYLSAQKYDLFNFKNITVVRVSVEDWEVWTIEIMRPAL